MHVGNDRRKVKTHWKFCQKLPLPESWLCHSSGGRFARGFVEHIWMKTECSRSLKTPKYHSFLDLEVVMKAASFAFPADCSLYLLFAHHHCTSLCPFSHEDPWSVPFPFRFLFSYPSYLLVLPSVSRTGWSCERQLAPGRASQDCYRIAKRTARREKWGKNKEIWKKEFWKNKLLIHFDLLSSNFINLYSLFGICFAIFWFEDLILHSALMEHLEGAASRKTMTCICCALFLDGT